VNAPATKSTDPTLPSISISASRKRKAQSARQRDTRGDRYTLGSAYTQEPKTADEIHALPTRGWQLRSAFDGAIVGGLI